MVKVDFCYEVFIGEKKFKFVNIIENFDDNICAYEVLDRVDRALMSCVNTNIASERSIVKNGGVLENEVFADGEVYKRFWIELK